MAKAKRPKKKSAGNPLHNRGFVHLAFILSFVLFVGGQFVLFAVNPSLGFLLSVAGALSAGFFYFKGDSIALPEVKFQNVLANVQSDIKGKVKSLKAEPAKANAWKLEPFKAKYGLSIAGVVIALILGGAGQFLFRQAGNDSTFAPGLILLLIAAAVFTASFFPWFREGIKNLALSSRTEMIAFGVLLCFAAFMRFYHVTAMPQGLFIDQGFVGYSALRIIHEGWRPFYISEIFLMAYSLAIYQVALWFKIFGENETALRTFYVFLAMLGLPFIYWTFRQLAGARMALAVLFVLAFMRWHIIFSRNQFPTIQVPLYMFATLAFLLYGLNNAKRWAFVTAGVLFGLGFYTYQGFKIMPLLLVVYTAYECFADWKRIKKNWLNVAFFLGTAVLVTSPILGDMLLHHNYGDREAQLSIMAQVKAQHSWKPFWQGLGRTAIMFNRKGDPNARHNLQDFKMFDDVSGVLFILGLVYALVHIKRRKYFYAVAGFFVTSLLCILTIDAAHANRLVAAVPFMAFLIATPISVIWARVLKFGGSKAEWVFLAVLMPFAGFMAYQNYDVYFNRQANDVSSWHEYAAKETNVGRRIAQYGPTYDYLIAPPYMGYYTVNFLGYKSLDRINPMYFPDALISHSGDPSRGIYFAVEEGRPAVAKMLKSIYPGAVEEDLLDPAGRTAVSFLRVPADQVAKVLGLKAVFDRPVGGVVESQAGQFPAGLPAGPYRVTLTGNLFINQSDDYRLNFVGNVRPVMSIGGQLASASIYRHLERGYYPVKIQLTVPVGVTPKLKLQKQRNLGLAEEVKNGDFNSLPPFRALKGSYYRDPTAVEKPYATQWDPILDYGDGNEWPTGQVGMARWDGQLEIAEGGNYQFFIQTRAGDWRVDIDGKECASRSLHSENGVYLRPGIHTINVVCVNRELSFPTLSLYWAKPDGKTEVVPNSAFGLVR